MLLVQDDGIKHKGLHQRGQAKMETICAVNMLEVCAGAKYIFNIFSLD